MTKRLKLISICAACVAMALATVPLRVVAQKTDRAKSLGTKLMCMCGCGQILTQCNHLNCPSSGPMLKELDMHVSKGEADDLIIQDFVQEYGEKVLSAPPSTGFNALAWYIPGFAFVIGLAVVIMVIRLWRQRDIDRVATAGAAPRAPYDSPTDRLDARLEEARRRADRETDD